MNSMDDSRLNYPQLRVGVPTLVCVAVRPLARLLIILLFLVQFACATTDREKVGTGTDVAETTAQRTLAEDKAQLNKPLTTATYPGSQVPVDEKSGLVAGNLVIALQQVFKQRALSPGVSFRRPGNSFELHLVEQLQRAGFAVFVARQETGRESSSAMDEQLYYGIERVSRGGVSDVSKGGPNNDPEFNDYSFSLQFKDFSIQRQYRVSAQSVHPLSPMVMMFVPADQLPADQLELNQLELNRLAKNRLAKNQSPQTDQPKQPGDKEPSDLQAVKQILLPTDDSLFYN